MRGVISSAPELELFKDFITLFNSFSETGKRNKDCEISCVINLVGSVSIKGIPFARFGPKLTKKLLNVFAIKVLSEILIIYYKFIRNTRIFLLIDNFINYTPLLTKIIFILI